MSSGPSLRTAFTAVETGVAWSSGAGVVSRRAAPSASTAGSSQASQASGSSMIGCRSWMCPIASTAVVVMTVVVTSHRSGSSSSLAGSFQNSYSPAIASGDPSAGCR